MRQITLSGLVQRRFAHCITRHGLSVRALVLRTGIPPADLCKLLAGQDAAQLDLSSIHRIAQWLHMPLANAMLLAGRTPAIAELVRLGMTTRGYTPTDTRHQVIAAAEVGVSVASFRRALHGYADFRPAIRTCDRFAQWLSWTGFDAEDIAVAAGMVVRYQPDGRRVTITREAEQAIAPYPCACGRAGCMVTAHIPHGPRRKWRSDACRMWSRRNQQRAAPVASAGSPALPQDAPIVRFIMINERPVPVRF